MKIGRPKKILDPYDWLPGYGESGVAFYSHGTTVALSIEYERKDVTGELKKLKREMVFRGVRTFIKVPFPNADFFALDKYSGEVGLGDLTEFIESDLKKDDLEGKGGNLVNLRHFSIQFLSENFTFHIISKGVQLSEEVEIV